jgi:hypothetical protein
VDSIPPEMVENPQEKRETTDSSGFFGQGDAE